MALSSAVCSGRAEASASSPKMRLLRKVMVLMFLGLVSRRWRKLLYWISMLLLLVLNTTSARRARPITSQIHAPETGGAGRRLGLPGAGGGVVRGGGIGCPPLPGQGRVGRGPTRRPSRP